MPFNQTIALYESNGNVILNYLLTYVVGRWLNERKSYDVQSWLDRLGYMGID
jgi:hypothetical protein